MNVLHQAIEASNHFPTPVGQIEPDLQTERSSGVVKVPMNARGRFKAIATRSIPENTKIAVYPGWVYDKKQFENGLQKTNVPPQYYLELPHPKYLVDPAIFGAPQVNHTFRNSFVPYINEPPVRKQPNVGYVLDYDTGLTELWTERAVKKDEEVTVCYGTGFGNVWNARTQKHRRTYTTSCANKNAATRLVYQQAVVRGKPKKYVIPTPYLFRKRRTRNNNNNSNNNGTSQQQPPQRHLHRTPAQRQRTPGPQTPLNTANQTSTNTWKRLVNSLTTRTRSENSLEPPQYLNIRTSLTRLMTSLSVMIKVYMNPTHTYPLPHMYTNAHVASMGELLVFDKYTTSSKERGIRVYLTRGGVLERIKFTYDGLTATVRAAPLNNKTRVHAPQGTPFKQKVEFKKAVHHILERLYLFFYRSFPEEKVLRVPEEISHAFL